MKKKMPKKGRLVPVSQNRKGRVEIAIPIDVDFPAAGDQDCFPATQGEPLIASGDNPDGGYRVVGARLIYADGSAAVEMVGSLFSRADYQPDGGDPDYLASYPEHMLIDTDSGTGYGADTKWAVAFPGVTASTLPTETQLFLIVRAMNFNHINETVVAFRYVP